MDAIPFEASATTSPCAFKQPWTSASRSSDGSSTLVGTASHGSVDSEPQFGKQRQAATGGFELAGHRTRCSAASEPDNASYVPPALFSVTPSRDVLEAGDGKGTARTFTRHYSPYPASRRSSFPAQHVRDSFLPPRGTLNQQQTLPLLASVLPITLSQQQPTQPQHPPQQKQPLIGPYALLSHLGKGSYGTVYLAASPSGEHVAVKRVPLYLEEKGKGKRANPHVVAEVGSLGRVRGCREVVQLRDVLYTTSHANLILEYHPGMDLLRFMEARKRQLPPSLPISSPYPGSYESIKEQSLGLPEDFVKRVVRDVLKALMTVHERGVVHRDVKLDNILVHPSHPSKLIDFNLSALYTQQSPHTGLFVETTFTRPAGSLHYCAPSVLRTCVSPSDGYTARGGWIDVYSLGVATYCMLVGRFPFAGRDAREILRSWEAKGGLCSGGEEHPISAEARNFVESCVEVASGRRAIEMLGDAWLA